MNHRACVSCVHCGKIAVLYLHFSACHCDQVMSLHKTAGYPICHFIIQKAASSSLVAMCALDEHYSVDQRRTRVLELDSDDRS